MRHQWRLCRTLQEHRDGQRRWDRAYQLLLEWAQTPAPVPAEPGQNPLLPLPQPVTKNCLEVTHARRDLCPRVDPTANPDPDY
jgi:hypothetical protein